MTLRAVAGGAGSGVAIGGAVSGGAAYAVLREDASQNLAADTNLTFGGAAAGTGLKVVGGTAVAASVYLGRFTRTNNNALVDKGFTIEYTDTTSAAGFKPFEILGDTTGAVSLFSVNKNGMATAISLAVSGSATVSGSIQDVTAGFWKITNAGANTLKFASSATVVWAATDANNGTTDTGFSRISAGVVGVGNGTGANISGTISAAAFISGGSAGVDFGPGVVTSITVKKGIITAIS